MTPEERFERQMQFILKQQAQFYADMREMDERLSRQIAGNSEQIRRNAEQIQQLTNLLFRTGRVVEELGRRTDELRESQKQTDVRLNILIDVVERYFSNATATDNFRADPFFSVSSLTP
ncbi:hypothetical protein MYX65_11215 [Acidobacteria bacterium AH-259-L09]|nr:hypothetical protein [Acidobacteria bacterium AH-259-L09]